MNKKEILKAVVKFLSGVIIVFLLLFLPAGDLNYYNGWLLMCLLFIPMLLVGIFLMIKNPKLLELRLNAKEKENEQKIVVILSALMFIIGFIVSGLNYRYNWYIMSDIAIIIGVIIFVISNILYAEILRENTFLSRTIEVVDNQKVVDTGFYKIVRHPMYLITILLFLSMPLVLNSLYSLFVFLIYPIIMVIRINNEEKILEKDLKGYKEYKNKVKYKLIPFIW